MLEVDKYFGKKEKKRAVWEVFFVCLLMPASGGADLCIRVVRLLSDHVKEVGHVASEGGAFQAEGMASTKTESWDSLGMFGKQQRPL